MLDGIQELLGGLPEPLGYVVWTVAKILAIVLPIMIGVAYLTFAERKVIGYIQVRVGPNRVGPRGWLQPIADGVKLLFKETIIPTNANKFLFIIAPVLTFAPSIAAWAVVPFDDGLVLSNVDAGLLYILAITSVGVYGVIIAGWASNSKYALLGALRSAAQIISYEIAMGFALVGVILAAGSLNLTTIVEGQQGVAEGESEIVAGFHVEYSAMTFSVFFLAEYANMILISVLTSIMFLGGWLSPFEGIPLLGELFAPVPGIVWLLLKASFFLFLYLWFRATFPRYRYDQIMRLGWKVFIPITIVWLLVVGAAVVAGVGPWFD